jgi:hypothetical protein
MDYVELGFGHNFRRDTSWSEHQRIGGRKLQRTCNCFGSGLDELADVDSSDLGGCSSANTCTDGDTGGTFIQRTVWRSGTGSTGFDNW